jgi:hypothetical protein
MGSNDDAESPLVDENAESEAGKEHGNKSLKDRIRDALNLDGRLAQTYAFSTKPLKLALNEIHSPFTHHPIVIHSNVII